MDIAKRVDDQLTDSIELILKLIIKSIKSLTCSTRYIFIASKIIFKGHISIRYPYYDADIIWSRTENKKEDYITIPSKDLYPYEFGCKNFKFMVYKKNIIKIKYSNSNTHFERQYNIIPTNEYKGF